MLKRTRVRDDLNDSFGGSRKRIRLCEQDSTGADIEPKANDEELVTEIKDSEQGEKNVDDIVTALNTSDKQSETPTVKFEIDKSNY